MTVPPGSDLLLSRDRAAILAEILAARTSYAPDWLPAANGSARGLADIHAGQLELLQQRLAQVPAHRQAVMLDQLGVSVLPAQGARTHVLLTAVSGTRGARVPLGTRIGATVPGRDTPIVFETVDALSISPAALVEVHSVDPAADAEQDHSADVLARRPVTLFSDPVAVDREIYVGHDELLAFDGRAVVELEVGVGVSTSARMPLEWTWWDGESWRAFGAFAPSALEAGDDDSVDGTAGLTRSGTIRLVAPCAASKPIELGGRTTYWIRGRLTTPFDMPTGASPRRLSRMRLASVNEHRRLHVRRSRDQAGNATLRVWWRDPPKDPGLLGGQVTRHLYDLTTGVQELDAINVLFGNPELLTTTVGHSIRIGVSATTSRAPVPPGVTPDPTKPRRVALSRDDDLTAPQLADPSTTIDVTVVRGLPLDKAIADQRAADISKTFAPLGLSPIRGTAFMFASATATRRPGSRVTLVIERPTTASEEADKLSGQQESAVQTAKKMLDDAIGLLEGATISGALDTASATLGTALPVLISTDPATWYAAVRQHVTDSLTSLRAAAASDHAVFGRVAPVNDRDLARVLVDIAKAVEQLAAGGPAAIGAQSTALQAAIAANNSAAISVTEGLLNGALAAFLATATPWLPPGPLPPIFATDPTTFVTTVTNQINGARTNVDNAKTKVAETVTTLKDINPGNLVTAIVPAANTELDPPGVEWEYHDGDRWRALGVDGDPQVLALQASGSVSFTVPDDIAEVDVNGDLRRWMRARLAVGSYSHLRLVSWTDKSGAMNFLPVIEPRAPLVDRIEVFYTHRSPTRDPGAVLSHDVHRWRDLTADLRWPGQGAAPFLPMPDQSPTLYLGFDGELPIDRIAVWLQLSDPSPWATPHRPVWEGYDGREWVRLPTDDGTDGLRRTGVVGLLWPGTTGVPGFAVVGAIGKTVSMMGRGAALRFGPGDQLMIADLQGQEPLVVSAADAETVTTAAPLSRAYAGAQLTAAPPARFGTPRTWVRAVFDPTQPAPQLAVAAIVPHAVEVAQVETLRDELLGSGDGSPAQTVVSRRAPVSGDADLEVRELDGDRAALDAEVLTRTLVADGIDPATVRLVQDARTGRVSEVWVPWAPIPSLGAAGPQDRVYLLDHASGRFIFGGAGHGRPLPEGRDNVRLRSYRTCDGVLGNVGAGTLTKLLNAVAVSDVVNPEPASGGADVEPLAAALSRGPALLRHRRLAITERDVEAIALEASPAVVRARALGAVDRYGRPAPGAVRLVIVPRDGTPQPTPGAALLAEVRDAVAAALPAVAANRLTVEGPSYRPVGVTAAVLPVRAGDSGPVREGVDAALRDLMHPLRGGPMGTGWDFGANAYLSDLAAALRSVAGVDAVTDLVLTVDGVPVGDVARVRSDQVVCAGPLSVRLGQGV